MLEFKENAGIYVLGLAENQNCQKNLPSHVHVKNFISLLGLEQAWTPILDLADWKCHFCYPQNRKNCALKIENSILHRSYDRNTSVLEHFLWFCMVQQYNSQRALIQAAATLGSSPQPANPCSMLAVHVLLKLDCVCYVMGVSRTLNIEG